MHETPNVLRQEGFRIIVMAWFLQICAAVTWTLAGVFLPLLRDAMRHITPFKKPSTAASRHIGSPVTSKC